MKKLAHLLIVLSLIGFSACGKKKNKASTNAPCQPGISCSSSFNTTGYNGSSATQANKASIVAKLNSSNAGFASFNSSFITYHVGEEDYDNKSKDWFQFSWSWGSNNSYDNTYAFSATSDGAILYSTNGTIHDYGRSSAAVQARLVSEVSNSTGLVQVGNNVFKVREADGDIITLDFNYPIAANPTLIEKRNGTVSRVYSSSNGF